MNNIVVFTPKPNLSAAENLRAFVTMCRDELTVFGADLEFDSNVWDISGTVKLKARGNKRFRVFFSTLETADQSTVDFISEPFLSFAKAVFRYSFGMRPTKSPTRQIAALRALESALRESGPTAKLVNMTTETFNRAAQLVKERVTQTTAYRVGGQLESLAGFLSRNRLVAVPIDWRNPVKRPSDSTRVGKEFADRRAEKLPSEAALHALPKIFHLATEPIDEIVTSVAAILCSAPDRVNEVLLLPQDCEVNQKDKEERNVYGLRWWPAKGADPMVKWVVPSMSSVVSDAIAKVRRLSEPARRIARWYEKKPSELFLPSKLRKFRKREYLSMKEVALVLFGDQTRTHEQAARDWCKIRHLPFSKVGKLICARFRDIERAVLNMLPNDFPYVNREVGLRFKDALFVIPRGLSHSRKATYSCMVAAVTTDQIATGLGAKVGPGYQSIFQKHGFYEPDGSAIKVTTQQFRHYLNTLAQAGGLSQLDIAKWSGRKDIRQNAAYDHVSADELVEKIRSAVGSDQKMVGPLAEMPKPIVMRREDFAALKVPTAHATELGFCVHDYTMAPCPLHGDCVNCNEQVCIKGDEVRTARIRHVLQVTKKSLEAAEKADAEGEFGASRWVEHHRLTVERLTRLCEILDDPNVPVGAIIQLSGIPTVSTIRRASIDRASVLVMQTQPPRPAKARALPDKKDVADD